MIKLLYKSDVPIGELVQCTSDQVRFYNSPE